MFGNLKTKDPVALFRIALVVCFILFAAGVRVLPHPWNFTPIGALALFSGAKITNKWAALLVPLSALLLGDLFVGFYKFMFVIYLSFCLSVFIGRYVRDRQTLVPLAGAAALGAVQFFLVSNFAVWAYGFTAYAKSFSGLASCYVAGLPLLGNTLGGDAFYCGILFGGFALAERFAPALRTGGSAVVRHS
jgi:hypothetical protein